MLQYFSVQIEFDKSVSAIRKPTPGAQNQQKPELWCFLLNVRAQWFSYNAWKILSKCGKNKTQQNAF